jgi:hypothetical protein
MKPSLKKINSELFRKALLRTAKPFILNDCPRRLKECIHQEAIDATKTGNQQVDICSHCYIDFLFEESEV